jgi:AmmeMemoRadiSam system protein A
MKTAGTVALPYGLTQAHVERLFDIARTALHKAVVEGDRAWLPDLDALPEPLHQPAATFVTLHTRGQLHGCIGSVEPRRPLAWDVARNAVAAALDDPRFPPMRPHELDDTEIEISILSPLQELPYRTFADLVARVRPGIDGVMVARGWQRGLLLPQVWESIPDPARFLEHVALKAGAGPEIYDDPRTRVYVFQVHSFTQPAPNARRGA